MDVLPDEIIPAIAGCLPPSDAIQLNDTSKALHSKLSLTVSSPRQILAKFDRGDCDDVLHYGFQVPVPRQVSCHSALLSLTWRDQGWGNRKGRLVIEAEEGGRDRRTSGRRFGDGRVVFASDIASHHARRLDITFRPRESETYHLWYAVGGGGGHALRLSDVRIQVLVLGDPGRCFGKAYDVLVKSDVLGVWDRQTRPSVHRDVDQLLAALDERLRPPSMPVNDVGHLPAATLDLKVRALVWSLWQSWMNEYLAYAKILSGVPSQRFNFYNDVQDDDFLEDRMDFGEFVVLED